MNATVNTQAVPSRALVVAATHPAAREYAREQGIERPIIVTTLDSISGLDLRPYRGRIHVLTDLDGAPRPEVLTELVARMRTFGLRFDDK